MGGTCLDLCPVFYIHYLSGEKNKNKNIDISPEIADQKKMLLYTPLMNAVGLQKFQIFEILSSWNIQKTSSKLKRADVSHIYLIKYFFSLTLTS